MFNFATDERNVYKLGKELFWMIFIRRDKKLDKLLNEIMEVSKSRGFPDLKLSIWRLRWPIITRFNAQIQHNSHKGVIFISTLNTTMFKEKDLKIVIAHEVGHHIDAKTKVIPHLFTDRIRKINLNDEEIAWLIAAHLYSKDEVEDYSRSGLSGSCDLNKIKNIETCNVHHKLNGVE